MNYLQALLLGLLQGLTEFLPVSSSGHIELGKALLGVNTSDNLLFSIVVHAATALSTIVVFRKEIFQLLKGLFKFKKNYETNYISKILISMIPVGIIGILFEDVIEELFEGKIMFVGFMLLLTAFLLFLSTRVKQTGTEVTFRQAFLTGIAQAIAILPGLSRSGATISTALLVGVDRGKAARFSFLMVLPPIFGGTLLELIEYYKIPASQHDISQGVLLVGFIFAFISGWFACKWMIEIVKRSKLHYFAFYCLVVGIIAIVTTGINW